MTTGNASTVRGMTGKYASLALAYGAVLHDTDLVKLKDVNTRVIELVWGRETTWFDLEDFEKKMVTQVNKQLDREGYIKKSRGVNGPHYEITRGPRWEAFLDLIMQNPEFGRASATPELLNTSFRSSTFVKDFVTDAGKKAAVLRRSGGLTVGMLKDLIADKEGMVLYFPQGLDKIPSYAIEFRLEPDFGE